MNRHLTKALATCGCVAALCLGLAGCGTGGAAAAGPEHTITVSASSRVHVVPDICNFSVTVTQQGETSSAAQDAAAKPIKDVIAALTKLGVEEKDIQTTYTDTSPVWDDEGQRTDLFESRTSLQVSNVPVEQVGALMQAATDAGASEVGQLEYRSSTYHESYAQALTQAVEETRPKAEALAQASSVKLGKVIAVSEGYQDMTYLTSDAAPLSAGAVEEADMDKGIDIAPGEVNIEAQVTVTYAIN